MKILWKSDVTNAIKKTQKTIFNILNFKTLKIIPGVQLRAIYKFLFTFLILSYNNNYETFAVHIDTKDECV